MLRFIAIAIALAAGGCASAPNLELQSSHPASPDSKEGAQYARQTSLRSDDATRKSRQILSAAKKEQEDWDKFGPVSGTPEGDKQDGKMDMKHENH